MKIGKYIKQLQGYRAFIPESFPPREGFDFPNKIIQKANKATLSLGKLDGVTQLLPDVDFFLFMYICKDAASSSQIEGTKATMIDAIEATSKITDKLPEDVDDILHYIQALNYGLMRLKVFPVCLRLIKEIHQELMRDARSSHFSDPGSFRKTQNWIGGTMLNNALFVPPPVEEMKKSMSELEKFFHQSDDILPVIKAGLIHAQFETIHPFLDGNGRTGRMLITIFLLLEKLLDRPVLFLSSYFKKHRKVYYDRIHNYHEGKVGSWIDFFLDGVIETSIEAIEVAKKITYLREQDLKKIHSLGKIEAKKSVEILYQLFKLPIVNVHKIVEWTSFTRQGAYKVIKRFVELNILQPKEINKTYGQSYIYRQYLDIFKD